MTAPATRWFLAEGATGPFFDEFVLLANPSSSDARVRVTYLLTDGRTFQKDMVTRANARTNIWVDCEAFDGVPGLPLADAALLTTVKSLDGVPLIVERAMWWPGDASTWHEAHNSSGATETGTLWALAEGEVGGARAGHAALRGRDQPDAGLSAGAADALQRDDCRGVRRRSRGASIRRAGRGGRRGGWRAGATTGPRARDVPRRRRCRVGGGTPMPRRRRCAGGDTGSTGRLPWEPARECESWGGRW